MLRFDRYVGPRGSGGARDLATGRRVTLRLADGPAPLPLWTTRGAHTLIDLDRVGDASVTVWERWRAPLAPAAVLPAAALLEERLQTAREGVPMRVAVPADTASARELGRRVLARIARLHGWVPVDLEWLARVRARGTPAWLRGRSLAVIADRPPAPGAVEALEWLACRGPQPHVLVTLGPATSARARFAAPSVREGRVRTSDATALDLAAEARARWDVLLAELLDPPAFPGRAVALADVLIAREQRHEARAWVRGLDVRDEGLRAAVDRVESQLAEAAARAAREVAAHASPSGPHGRWPLVDDFLGVLQLCQDTEDDERALARVGAFLRDRLQASTVAFVAREGREPRVVARAGLDPSALDLALRAMESAAAVEPAATRGPAETACPVRHAAEVIGAIWCRWGAGTPVAPDDASALLGVAAVAAGPSLRGALERLKPPAALADAAPGLVGGSAAIVAVRAAIARAAGSPFPVLVEGESGSGKELVARAIHRLGPRRERRFCALNCAALVDDLVEAELFGHVRGAFTGAHADRAGLFEEANGGTLFLDEVAELGARVQAKLLRVLQEGEVRRLGESAARAVDPRIVCATNRGLAEEAAAGRFRRDLHYRLDVVRIVVPPLRDRLEDLPALVQHLWHGLRARTGSRAVLSPRAVPALAAYDWPGNVRELQNVLASLMVSAPARGVVPVDALPAHLARVTSLAPAASLQEARVAFERRFVRAALARAGGRVNPAARELGLTRQGLFKKMQRLGLAPGAPAAATPHVE